MNGKSCLEGIADHWTQREAWFKIALLVSPIPAHAPAKSVKNQLIHLRIQEGVWVCVKADPPLMTREVNTETPDPCKKNRTCA